MRNIDSIKQQILPLLKKYDIKKAGIFGSVARKELNPHDLDILVEINKKISLLEFISLKQEIEDTIGLKVDLVEYSSIKSTLKEAILLEEVPLL